MIEWELVSEGGRGLRIYRIEAQAPNLSTGASFDPLGFVLQQYPTQTVAQILERFSASGSPVGPSSFRVACHVVSLPEHLVVIDSTFHTTAEQIFPEALEAIAASEGRTLKDRPLSVVYTHAHFDHAGGRGPVERLGGDVEILCHPHTQALFPLVSRREMFFRTKDHFFRDCEIERSLEEIAADLREIYRDRIASAGPDAPTHPFSSDDESPLRVDRLLTPEREPTRLAGGRIEVLIFDGHIPGHLCLLIDGEHFVTGDMWLPATTSTVTPAHVAKHAGVPEDRCGFARYAESSRRLLDMDVDACLSYPSHEHVFRNPKRMAMRDLELFAERLPGVYAVLDEHRSRPLRVLDLAWGGAAQRSIWKLDGVKYRLLMAHDEAAAYVRDLALSEDLSEVEPERYLYTGTRGLEGWLGDLLAEARRDHGGLEFRSRAREALATG